MCKIPVTDHQPETKIQKSHLPNMESLKYNFLNAITQKIPENDPPLIVIVRKVPKYSKLFQNIPVFQLDVGSGRVGGR